MMISKVKSSLEPTEVTSAKLANEVEEDNYNESFKQKKYRKRSNTFSTAMLSLMNLPPPLGEDAELAGVRSPDSTSV